MRNSRFALSLLLALSFGGCGRTTRGEDPQQSPTNSGTTSTGGSNTASSGSTSGGSDSTGGGDGTGGSNTTRGGSGTGGASTGGSNSTEGSGGSAGSGGAPGASGAAGAGPGDCCLSANITWGPQGGFAAHAEYSLSDCASFSFKNVLAESCGSELPPCEASDDSTRLFELTPGNLNQLLADPDVAAALADAPITFGVDTRPVDGVALVIEVDGRRIVIGRDCVSDDNSCVPVPAGVDALRVGLDRVVSQQIDLGTCEKPLFCSDDPDTGPCTADAPRWYFDDESHTCQEFSYGGCEGNQNNFESLQQCMAACGNDPCSSATALETVGYCELTETIAAEHCFETNLQACECACYADGGSLDDCLIWDSAPAVAVCPPDG